ncbi:MAG: response regulator [Caldilineaceae bacterium]
MQETSIQTLLVEDNPGDTLLLRQMLADTTLWKAVLTCTDRLQAAIELCQQQPFEVILLDLSLPDSQGYATFEQLRQYTPQTPIILLTGFDDQELAVRAVRAGAQDYLIKDEINAHLLIRAMRYAIERKRTEEALREHHLRYQALFENNNIGVLIIGIDGLLVNLNQQAAVMLGDAVAHLIGTPLSTYIAPDERDEFFRQTEALLQGASVPIHEQTFMRCDGSMLSVELNSTLVRNGRGDILYVQSMAHDISKRKDAEAALQAERTQLAKRVEERTKELQIANAELKQTARLKDEFLATMSHELRTPLSAILTLSETLQDEVYGSLVERQRKALERIVKSGRHLLDLINDILDVSKIESGKLVLEIGPVSVTTLCDDCLQMLHEVALAKQIQFVREVRLTNDLTYVDGRRLMQILLNLLNNAVKFTPESGQVGIEVYDDVEHELLTFTVWDTGIGIAAEDTAKLFRPFVQLDSKLSRQYQGAGLGLALVYRLAELHGGSVTVYSTLNVGSRFTIVLPHRTKSRPKWSESNEDAAAFPGQFLAVADGGTAPTVLLADDNERSTVALKDELEQQGYRVILAPNGIDAVTQAQKYLPDLIFIDMQMPQMSGLEVLRQLRQLPGLTQMPIVALTALVVPGDRELCLAAGATEYISKPINSRTLRQLLRRYLTKNSDAAV